MKKILTFTTVLLFGFLLVACGNKDVTVSFDLNYAGATATIEPKVIKSGETVTKPADPKREGYEFKYWTLDGKEFIFTTEIEKSITLKADWKEKEDIDNPGNGNEDPGKKPTTIRIMHGALNEVDPFDPDFSGQNQSERQQLQKDVEKRLNVKVEYVTYPGSAGWGPSRVNAIIEAHTANKPLADIYWTTSSWTGQLANAKAITPISTKWLNDYGKNIGEATIEIGSYKNEFYGFSPANPTGQLGLYFNENLLNKYGIENPAEIFARGEWTWSTFETWSKNANAVLSKEEDKEEYVIGGAIQEWAQTLVPLNGGKFIDPDLRQVTFNRQPALETYAYLKKLWNENLFEPSGTYDAGSQEWSTGKVLIHPGSFWFLNSDNRFGKLEFDLGYVPYPISDEFKNQGGEYVTYVSGEAVYNIANGPDKEKQELAFHVWNELQLWRTEEQGTREFQAVLRQRLGKQIYVDAFLAVYKNIYLELLDDLGISTYAEGGFRHAIGTAIKEGDPRAAMESIRPEYQAALNRFYQ